MEKDKNNKSKPLTKKNKYVDWIDGKGLELLGGWARDGLTDEEIAKKVGISRSTLSEWKKKYPSLSDTLKNGKEIVDIKVENALLRRALGYSYVERTKEKINNVMVVTKEITKYVPPDTTAQIFWLKNRRPEQWREKRAIDANISIPNDNFIDALSNLAPNIKSNNDVEE